MNSKENIDLYLALSVEAAQIGTWHWNAKTNQLTWSKTQCAIYGVEEAFAPTTAEAFHRYVLNKDITQLLQDAGTISPENPWSKTEFKIRKTDGSIRWIESRSRTHFDQQKQVDFIVGINIDITERKEAEQKLKYSENLLKSIPDAVIATDNDFKVTSWNRIAEQLYGFSEEEMIGKRMVDVVKTEILDDQLKDFKTILSNTGSWSGEVIHHTKNGDQLYVHASATAFRNMDGHIAGVVTVNRDITERKKLEMLLSNLNTHLQLATESGMVGTWAYYLASQKLEWSPLHKVMWGYQETDDLNFEDWYKQIHPEDVAKCLYAVQFAKESHSLYNVEYRIFRKNDGAERWVRSTGLYQYDAEGSPIQLTGVSFDITSQKITEKNLRDAEQRLRLALEASSVGIWEWQVDTGQVKWDAQMFKIYGMPPTEYGFVQYEQWRSAVLPAHLAEQEQILQHTIDNGGSSKRSFSIIHQQTGELRLIESVETVRKSVDGKVEWVVGSNIDVTEQKNYEQKLRESQLVFQNLADNSPLWIWTTDLEVNVQYANKELLNYFGYTQVADFAAHTWKLFAHPEDIPLIYEKVAAAYERPVSFDCRLMNIASSKYEWFLIKVVPRAANGVVFGYIGTAININERNNALQELKESENRFRLLAESLPQLVWLTNAKGEYEYASKKWMEYSGIDPQGENAWSSIVHPDDLLPITTLWLNSLDSGNAYQGEVRLKNKEGHYRWHVVNGIAVRNGQDEIIKWVGAFTDIHERKMLDQDKDDFISIASHEMRTPLTTAKGFLDLLAVSIQPADDLLKLYTEKAGASVTRLAKLIDELLDVSKIQNGKLTYQFESFDFTDLLAETINGIQITLTTHTITCEVTGPIMITADRERIQQVLINLIMNAVKYSPKATEVITRAAIVDGQLQVSVTDFGIGLRSHHLEKIFDRYYRVSEHAKHFKGLGIGLYISNEIIKRHYGKMWVESVVEKGSVFYFSLPAKQG